MKRSLLTGALQGVGFLAVLLLALVVAMAADILTVDKDGVVRLRVSNTGKVTLNTSEAAEGDLRFTSRASDPTAPLAGDLWYNSNDATMKALSGTNVVNIPGNLARYSITKSTDFSTSSTSWVDVTDLSVTFVTDLPNQAVLISTTLRGYANTANAGNRIDFNLDGASLSGASYGIVGQKSVGASQSINLSCSFVTVVSTAGSHTVNVKTFADSGVTNVIQGAGGAPAFLQVLKFY